MDWTVFIIASFVAFCWLNRESRQERKNERYWDREHKKMMREIEEYNKQKEKEETQRKKEINI